MHAAPEVSLRLLRHQEYRQCRRFSKLSIKSPRILNGKHLERLCSPPTLEVQKVNKNLRLEPTFHMHSLLSPNCRYSRLWEGSHTGGEKKKIFKIHLSRAYESKPYLMQAVFFFFGENAVSVYGYTKQFQSCVDFGSNTAVENLLLSLCRRIWSSGASFLGQTYFFPYSYKRKQKFTPRLDSSAWVTQEDYSTFDFKSLNHQGLSYHNGNFKMSEHHRCHANNAVFFFRC